MSTFAERVIQFNRELSFTKDLPNDIKIMNPFQQEEIMTVSECFYNKFYKDNKKRRMILGINPGRLGAGVTGIPFTDTKRLSEICNIEMEDIRTHEPSSVFIYDLIEAYGGAEKFYGDFYINSMSPLGFIQKSKKGNWVNCNYYDYKELFFALKDFIIQCLQKQIELGIDTSKCFVLGKKNLKYVQMINDETGLFDSLEVLNHPRYIVQYQAKNTKAYLLDYLKKLKS